MPLVPCGNCGHEIVEHRLEPDLTTGACRRCDCEGFARAHDEEEREAPEDA
jgi:hypothetical protein